MLANCWISRNHRHFNIWEFTIRKTSVFSSPPSLGVLIFPCFDMCGPNHIKMEYSKKYPNRIMKLANLVDEIKISNWRSTIQIWESTWPRPSSSWPNYFSVFPPNHKDIRFLPPSEKIRYYKNVSAIKNEGVTHSHDRDRCRSWQPSILGYKKKAVHELFLLHIVISNPISFEIIFDWAENSDHLSSIE